MTIKKTYPKILLLIISSSVFFILLYFALYYYTTQAEKHVYRDSTERFYNEINKLLVLDSKPIFTTINNDTNWDEFVDFMKTKDQHWYDETIGNQMGIYQADYMGVYDIDKNFITHSATLKIKSIDFIPKQAIIQLNKSGLSRFYMRLPEGLIEVFGASIHPSNDPLKSKTKPSGYFFVARVLDIPFFIDLQKITSSDISILNGTKELERDKNKIDAEIDLKDFENNIVSKLLFRRNFDVYFDNVTNILYLIILAFFINLILDLIYTRKLVYRPLDLIAKVLENGDKKALDELKHTTGEFSSIGKLFEEYNIQKKELIKSKLKAEESDKLKSTFLANLSHEIRTPMNAIIGFTDLLITTKLIKVERIEYLKIIEKSGNNLVSIIDDLIEMSKIEANQVRPNYTVVNLESCIKELYETIKITIPKSKNIDFYIIEKDKSDIQNVITDEIKIKQIIVNLVTNAIKFTEEGFVAFGCEIDQTNAKINFTIKDTGPGIDKDKFKFVFDRFKRVDSESSNKAGGLGLGLAISKAYVEMMEGTISLESEVGKGSVFSFSLPLKIPEVQKNIVQPISGKRVFKAEEHATILIAEDDNINFLLFQKIMQSREYKVIRAVNGKEAVDMCQNNPDIDLVLMDIKMPIMDGYEALEKIKTLRPELHIIAQTAYASVEDKKKMKQAGFFDHIAKPINKEILFEIINRAIQNKE